MTVNMEKDIGQEENIEGSIIGKWLKDVAEKSSFHGLPW